jgi:hypothetical protein
MRIWPNKRRWKHIGIGMAVLLAIALIVNGFMAWRTEARWSSMIAAIRASGEPGSIAELAPKPIPVGHNAAALLAKLGPRLDAFSHVYGEFSDTPLGKAFDERSDRGEPATAAQMTAIRNILDQYSDLDAGIAAVAACEQYASVADFAAGYPKFTDEIMEKTMTRIRTAARFLRWRMYALITAGQQDHAVGLGIETLQLARQYDHEPALINMLVSAAVRGFPVEPLYDALATGPVSPKLHKALDDELALHEDPQRLVRTLKSERALAIDATEAQWHSIGPPAWLFRMVGWQIKRFYVGALEGLNAEIDILSTGARGRFEERRPAYGAKAGPGWDIK